MDIPITKSKSQQKDSDHKKRKDCSSFYGTIETKELVARSIQKQIATPLFIVKKKIATRY